LQSSELVRKKAWDRRHPPKHRATSRRNRPFRLERVHIVSTPGTCGGKPRIAGSRIQVKHLVIMHQRQGMSPEDIVSEFPHLSLADVYAALAYYHDHREAMNAEIAADRAWYENQKATQPSRLQERLKSRKSDAPDDSLPHGSEYV
jgi:uncharacterized protein (DUF433 family)